MKKKKIFLNGVKNVHIYIFLKINTLSQGLFRAIIKLTLN